MEIGINKGEVMDVEPDSARALLASGRASEVTYEPTPQPLAESITPDTPTPASKRTPRK